MSHVTQNHVFRFRHVEEIAPDRWRAMVSRKLMLDTTPTNDLWIAASAMEHNVELLTADSHFRHVPHILVSYLSS